MRRTVGAFFDPGPIESQGVAVPASLKAQRQRNVEYGLRPDWHPITDRHLSRYYGCWNVP
jgi:hypothetical protein